ncbi:hypothetical protein ACRAKI_22165 [Saccharothrix isguenensis]
MFRNRPRHATHSRNIVHCATGLVLQIGSTHGDITVRTGTNTTMPPSPQQASRQKNTDPRPKPATPDIPTPDTVPNRRAAPGGVTGPTPIKVLVLFTLDSARPAPTTRRHRATTTPRRDVLDPVPVGQERLTPIPTDPDARRSAPMPAYPPRSRPHASRAAGDRRSPHAPRAEQPFADGPTGQPHGMRTEPRSTFSDHGNHDPATRRRTPRPGPVRPPDPDTLIGQIEDLARLWRHADRANPRTLDAVTAAFSRLSDTITIIEQHPHMARTLPLDPSELRTTLTDLLHTFHLWRDRHARQ